MQMLLESTIFCTQQVTNTLHIGQPPLRGVKASLGPSSATLGGAAREQYAAMEAGGGAVAAPPKKGAARRPASRRPPRSERRHGAVRRDADRWRRVGSAPKKGGSSPTTGQPQAAARRALQKNCNTDGHYRTRGLAPRVRWRNPRRSNSAQLETK